MSEADDIQEFMGLAHKRKRGKPGDVRTFADFIDRLEELPQDKETKRAVILFKRCAAGIIDAHELCDRLGFDQDIRSKLVRMEQKERKARRQADE